MSISKSPSAPDSQPPEIPSGWTEFSLGPRYSARDQVDDEAFPSLLGAASSREKYHRPPSNVSRYVDNNKSKVANVAAVKPYIHTSFQVPSAAKLLKECHSWADDNLIEDILAAVNHDFNPASSILKSMVSPHEVQEESAQCSSNCTVENNSVDNMLSNFKHEILLPMTVFPVPMEPEFEEVDDIYVIHRKDAIKMMRAAAQHSRAANNAFYRGDHSSARELAQRAHDEWASAEQLNSKAADEILRIRNIDNDIRELDLHGLHPSEAVAALENRLQILELRAIADRPFSDDGLPKLGSRMLRSPSSGSIAGTSTKPPGIMALARRSRGVLHVVTGELVHALVTCVLHVVTCGYSTESFTNALVKGSKQATIDIHYKYRGLINTPVVWC